jgi:hypothetical protein
MSQVQYNDRATTLQQFLRRGRWRDSAVAQHQHIPAACLFFPALQNRGTLTYRL